MEKQETETLIEVVEWEEERDGEEKGETYPKMVWRRCDTGPLAIASFSLILFSSVGSGNPPGKTFSLIIAPDGA